MSNETNQTMIPRNSAAQCATCERHIPFTVTCEVYPEGIPLRIKKGENCPEFEAKTKD